MMDFATQDFLHNHVHSILQFYEPVVLDEKGGFFHNFQDDGSVFDHTSRHLVSSTRFIFNYAEAYRRGLGEHYRRWAQHGLSFLEQSHRLPTTGHYVWQLGTYRDETSHAYGHAFVLLAQAKGYQIGETECLAKLNAVDQLLIDQFYESELGVFADERSSDLSVLSDYRGQNANMHLCEAFIAAFEATKNKQFLARAQGLAQRFAVDFAAMADGLIWEHYRADWSIDWDYNIDKPDDLFRPWGFQPGHQVEWAKLLLQLNAIEPNEWYVQRACDLFNRAMEHGWDHEYGGIVYGFAPDGRFADDHKYFWVHAEAFAAAFRLYSVTGNSSYLQWYERIWEFSWEYLVDHSYGAWFRIRDRRGQPVDNLKSPMGKVDYHTLGACWDVLDQLQDTNPLNELSA